MTDEGGRVLIAQGQPWGGLPILVVMSTQITVLFTIVILAGAHFDHVLEYPLGVLELFIFASLFSAVYVLIWRATVGRVRYEVEGARIVVSRGRKMLAELDTTDYYAFYPSWGLLVAVLAVAVSIVGTLGDPFEAVVPFVLVGYAATVVWRLSGVRRCRL